MDPKTQEQLLHAEKLLEATKRRNKYSMEMKTRGTGGRILLYLQHKWFDIILLFVTMILSGAFLGIIAKIIWEIWLIIFSL